MPSSPLSAYHRRHLISHLLDRGRIDDACHVLFARRESGDNVFFVAREADGDLAGLLDDVSAAAARLRDGPSLRPGLELKLALLQCTVQNIAAREPLAMIGVRLETGLWRREDALRFAYAQQSSTRRGEALIAIAEALPHADNFVILRQALNALREPTSEPDSQLYTRLFDLMPLEGRTEVLAQIIERGDRTALADVLPLVSNPDVDAAITAGLEMIRAVTADSSAGKSLYSEALLTEGKQGTLEEHVCAAKAECIARLSERAPDRHELFDEAWRYASSITGDLRLQTQARAVRSAPSATLPALLSPLIDEALQTDVGVGILAREVASVLDGPTLLRLLARARQIHEPNNRVTVLSRVCPFLQPQEQEEVVAEALADLEAAWTKKEKPVFAARAFALNAGERLAPEQFARFLWLLEDVEDTSRFDLLLALVSATGGQSEPLIGSALQQAMGSRSGYDELGYILRLKDRVGSEGYHYLDAIVRYADHAKTRVATLLDSADRSLKASIWPVAERALQRMNDGSTRVIVLSALAAALDPGPTREFLIESASELCESLHDDDARLLARASLLRVVDAFERGQIVEQLTPHVSKPSGIGTETLVRAIRFVDAPTRARWAHRAAECVHRRAEEKTPGWSYEAAHWMSLTRFLPPGERDHIERIVLAEIGAEDNDDALKLDVAAECLPHVSEIRRTDLAIRIFRARSKMAGPTRGLAVLNTLAALPPIGNASWPISVRELAINVWDNALEIDCAVCKASLTGAAAVHLPDLPFATAAGEASKIPLDWILYRALNWLVTRRIETLNADEALAGWRAVLCKAPDLSRSRFLICVSEMVPILRKVAGQDGVEEAARGLLDITSCWS